MGSVWFCSKRKQAAHRDHPSRQRLSQWIVNRLNCVSDEGSIPKILSPFGFYCGLLWFGYGRFYPYPHPTPPVNSLTTQRASNAENVSTWWRHHVYVAPCCKPLSSTKNTAHSVIIFLLKTKVHGPIQYKTTFPNIGIPKDEAETIVLWTTLHQSHAA